MSIKLTRTKYLKRRHLGATVCHQGCCHGVLRLHHGQHIRCLARHTTQECGAPTIADAKYTNLECRASTRSTYFHTASAQTECRRLPLLWWQLLPLEPRARTTGQLNVALWARHRGHHKELC